MKKVLLLIILLPLLFSCRTAKDLEKNTEIKEIIKERHDTLMVHTRDSIYFSVIQKGDTVFNTKYIEKIKYIDRTVIQNDTIYQEKEVIKEKKVIKKHVPSWCWWLLLINATIIGIIGIKYYVRWRTK